MPSVKVTEAINLIKSSQKSSEVYVPSLKRNVKLKHLTAGQQERFVKALVDNPAMQSVFLQTLFSVIKENIEDKSIINQLTIIDKYAIGIALRCMSLGSNLKTEVESEPGVIYNINLEEPLNFVQTQLILPDLDPIMVENYRIDLQYPTIHQEAMNDKHFKSDDLANNNTPESLRAVISNAFISDVLLFIKTLTLVKEDGEELVIDFNSITIQEKLDIIRLLPNSIFENILDPLSKVKSIVESILKCRGVNEKDDSIRRSILVSFDASLFITAI